jgi:AraC-like DNA-binding protein
MELSTPFSTPSMVDLSGVQESLRAAAWRRSAQSCFPGLSVRDLRDNPAFGMIAGAPFGAGHLWIVLSPAVQVSYDPRGANDAQIFSVMLQIKGSTLARQGRRCGLLDPGELCVIDSFVPFELEVVGLASQFMILQMPRHAVIGRHPYLEHRTAEVFDRDETGTSLLRNVLLSLVDSAHLLQSDQRGAALAAVIQLLGAAKMPRPPQSEGVGWRVKAALALIDTELADPELDASRIADAQGISRRRLDEIMVAQVGASLTARIWLRRLDQAASDLLDERFAAKTVTQIAFAAGFEDAAHFTRAFKRRYGCTPRAWRRSRLKS